MVVVKIRVCVMHYTYERLDKDRKIVCLSGNREPRLTFPSRHARLLHFNLNI